jgi:putative ABC transport system permease protein
MDAVAARISAAFPSTSANVAVSVEPLKNNFLPSDTRTHLWLLLGAVGFVMLIACANVANLLLARGTVRRREIAVRMSLGATRREILGQFLVESLSLALVGGVVGVALGFGLLRVIVAIMPPFTLPSEAEVVLNLPVLFFTLGVTMFSGILFGCAPAFQAAGLSLSDTLKDGGRTGNDSGRHGLRRGLVVAEFAFAVVLLAGAGLALHSFWNLTRVDLGIRPAGVLTFSLPVPADRLKGAGEINAFYRRLLQEIRTIPGIQQAAVSTGMPIRGAAGGVQFSIAGRPVADTKERPGTAFIMVTPDYLDTFGAEVRRGRGFNETDTEGSLRVALVNEAFAARHLAGLDPLQEGLMISAPVPGARAPGPPVEWRIVGVFRDVRAGGLRGEPTPEVYVPFWQAPWPQTRVAVRTSGSPQGLAKSLAGAIKTVDPELPMVDVLTMQQVLDQLMANDRFNAVLYSMFAGVALLLAMVGISGVMAFTVAQRTHEIGLRTALGAQRRHVLALVLKEGLGLALVGLVLGLGGAFLLGRVMQGMLFGIEATDPVAFGSVSLLLLAAALVGCLLPAYRAARVDPLVALRQG